MAECKRDFTDIVCPNCRSEVMKSYNGRKKLRTRIVVFDSDGKARAKCPMCKSMVDIPVKISGENDTSDRLLFHVVKIESRKLEKKLASENIS